MDQVTPLVVFLRLRLLWDFPGCRALLWLLDLFYIKFLEVNAVVNWLCINLNFGQRSHKHLYSQ